MADTTEGRTKGITEGIISEGDIKTVIPSLNMKGVTVTTDSSLGDIEDAINKSRKDVEESKKIMDAAYQTYLGKQKIHAKNGKILSELGKIFKAKCDKVLQIPAEVVPKAVLVCDRCPTELTKATGIQNARSLLCTKCNQCERCRSPLKTCLNKDRSIVNYYSGNLCTTCFRDRDTYGHHGHLVSMSSERGVFGYFMFGYSSSDIPDQCVFCLTKSADFLYAKHGSVEYQFRCCSECVCSTCKERKLLPILTTSKGGDPRFYGITKYDTCLECYNSSKGSNDEDVAKGKTPE